MTTSIRPDSSPNPTTDSSTPTDPTVNLSLLILFPSPFDETTEDYAELPELVIGTTTVIPILRHTEPPAPIEGKSTEDYEKDVIETDVAHLEYAAPVVSELRRATWKKTDSGWVVEGFEAI